VRQHDFGGLCRPNQGFSRQFRGSHFFKSRKNTPIFKVLPGFKVLSQSASRFLTKNYTQMKELYSSFYISLFNAKQTLETRNKKENKKELKHPKHKPNSYRSLIIFFIYPPLRFDWSFQENKSFFLGFWRSLLWSFSSGHKIEGDVCVGSIG